ncbi:hypothetical protein [Acidisoma sp. C75]
MADKDHPPTVEPMHTRLGTAPGVSNANAPLLYFENVPAFGTVNGIIKVTLTASRDIPLPDNNVAADQVVIAYLRMNEVAARALRAALDGALLLASPTGSGAPN